MSPLLTSTAPAVPASQALTGTGAATTAEATGTVENWSDLEVCVALYWVRRFRGRGDLHSARVWTERLDLLLDWRNAHGPHVPLPHAA